MSLSELEFARSLHHCETVSQINFVPKFISEKIVSPVEKNDFSAIIINM